MAVLLLQPVLGVAVLAPLVTVLVRRRWNAVAVALWVLGPVPVAGRYVAVGADVDRADSTGTAGDPFAGWPWFVAACLADGVSLRLAWGGSPRRSRPEVRPGR